MGMHQVRKKNMKKKKSKSKKSFLSSPEWKSLRQAHLKKEPCCVICGSQDKLIVHHILYRRGYSEQQANPKNLATLCKRCHYLVHRGSLGLLLFDYLLQNRPKDLKFLLKILKNKRKT